jgi:cellulose synthase/poly-beta-1,6-N-acetylglucosamine synthase-like glycosyltransferase
LKHFSPIGDLNTYKPKKLQKGGICDVKKMTVTVGIPAYNEGANILNILKAVSEQIGDSYTLQKVILMCDGCSDNTVSSAKKFAKEFKKLQIIDNKTRKGKVTRLNQLYRLNKSDILINFDGDIMLGSIKTIEEIVKIFQNEPKTVMVTCHQIPLKTDTFMGKMIYAGYEFWDRTRLSVKDCDNIQNHYGAASAYRGSYIKNIQIPKDVTDERGYLYLVAKRAGDFRYTFNALIYYRPVSTFKDFVKMGERSFGKNRDQLVKYFGEGVYNEYYIPRKYKIKSVLICLLKNPIYTCGGIFLNIYSRWAKQKDKLYDKGTWEIAKSTKAAIPKNLVGS